MVSTRESTSCPGGNTENSDTIHSLYSKNDLHLLLAFPLPRAGGVLQQPVLFAQLSGVFTPSSGKKCRIMEAWRPKEESSFRQKCVCVCVCVCVLGVQNLPAHETGKVRDGKMKEHT